MVAELLKGSDVKTCTVVGFPLGAVDSEIKAYETSKAIADGANEIDMVINIGAVKDKNYEYVLNDIKAVRDACTGKILKVILETCLLDDEEKIKVCELAKEAGADFVKTSTGFSTSGAKTEDVRLMRKTVGESMGVKASGGIRDIETAEKMIEAGATRLGTSKLILSE
jgi:deoxyribose-phosphate aldolase